MNSTQNTVKVWDPIVRIGHWTLVLAFFIAYFTEDDLLTQHVWAGYVAGAVVCFRLLWGFVGTEHARFKDFVVSPAVVLQHLRDLRDKSGKRYIGHNPIGGAMIIALLISVAVTVYTGVALYAIEDHAGPLAAWFATESAASEPARETESSAESEERESKANGIAQAEATDEATDVDEADEAKDADEAEDPREEFWEDLHDFFADFTVVLVILHIAGGLFSSYVYKENLIRAMFTGRKRP